MPGALPGVGRDAETRNLRRIRELEEELRVLRIESDKQVRITTFLSFPPYELKRAESL